MLRAISLIVSAKLNDVDPRAWLAKVLRPIADIPSKSQHELLPWEWKTANAVAKAAA